MKRSWFGAGLLAVLLAAALLVGWGMDRAHDPVVLGLEKAGKAAWKEDWAEARHQLRQTEGQWQRWEGFRSCFADHTPMEEIEGEFAQLSQFALLEGREDFCALAAQTAKKVQAMGDAHSLDWGNFF